MARLLIIVLFIFQLGCKKNENYPTYTSSFSFMANNTSYVWTFNFDVPSQNGYGIITKYPGTGGMAGGYMVEGFNQSQNVSINCFIETNLLATGTYKSITTASTGIIQSGYGINGVNYAPINLGDSVVVNITSISNNTARGTFNAIMHDVSTRSVKVEINNGFFDNLIISN